MKKIRLIRSVSVAVASALFLSASAQGVSDAARALYSAIVAQIPTSDYTDNPGTPDAGANPQSQPINQGGLWDDQTLASYRDSVAIEAGLSSLRTPPVGSYSPGDTGDNQAIIGQPAPLPRSMPLDPTPVGPGDEFPVAPTPPPPSKPMPVTPGPISDPNPGVAIGPTGGEGNNWEGNGPGGGSALAPGYVNTQTGNRFTTMPITGWKTKGGLPFGLTLYHNAQDNTDIGWGLNWRSNFDMRVFYTGNLVNGNRDYLTVVYPTGKRLTFTREKTGIAPDWGASFYPPKGYYDMVFVTPSGYRLRTPDQKLYTFNGSGCLTSIADRYGNAIGLTYNGNQMTKATDASGRSLTFAWGSVILNTSYGNVSSLPCVRTVTNAAGQTWAFNQNNPNTVTSNLAPKYLNGVVLPSPPNSTEIITHAFGYSASGAIVSEGGIGDRPYRFLYDAYLRLTNFTDPYGKTTTYTYNGGNTVVTKSDGGKQTDFYDGGVLRSEQDEAGFSKTYWYDASYNVVQMTNERGKTYQYQYDAFGNRIAGQDPRQFAAGVKTRATYNSYNDVLTQVDARGATTTISRDPSNGVVLSVKDAIGNIVATNGWESTGALANTTSVNATTTITYDVHGNPQSVMGPSGSVTLAYGDLRSPDKPTASTDDRGRTTGYSYDYWGRLFRATRSDGATMSIEYDAMSRVKKVVDWLGHATTYWYDGGGRRTSKQNARGDFESYGYDACGRVKTITDGRGNIRTYRYTLRGEVAGLTLPDGATEGYRYDAAGNQTVRTNALSQSTYYEYDGADNLASVGYPTGPGVTYVYDLDGRTTSMTDGTGVSTWSYDLDGRTTTLATPQGTQSYGYDLWSRRTTLTQGVGNITTTNYTNEKATSVVKAPENETTTWGYDGFGRIVTQTLPNGAVTSYGYDALDRVSAITHKKANGAVISAETYLYDAGGNLTYKVVDGVRTDYGYDAIDQLTSEVTPGSSVSYTYDGNGNRLTRTTNGGVETYQYDDGDKLLSRSGPAGMFAYGYDACGRTRTVQSSAGTTTLTYDYEDRLTNIVGPGLNATYAYNGADARVGKSGTGGARTYRRDGVGVTAPVLGDGVSTMVPGISERSAGASRFSHLDRLGTNARTTNPAGATVESRSYDAFGLPRVVNNPSGSQRGFAGAFGYQEDAESGLKLLGHRYYDPGSGRFITRDPIGSGLNWYRYADNNPLKQIDPTGLTGQDVRDYDKSHGTNYSQKVEDRIKSLRENGEAKAADELQELLAAGKIMVDTDPKRWARHYPDGRPFSAGADTANDGTITLNPGTFIISEYLETLLLHEVTHELGNKAGLPHNELFATTTAAAYARRRANRVRRTTRDGSDVEWDKTARANDTERDGFADRDRRTLAAFFQKIFGGVHW